MWFSRKVMAVLGVVPLLEIWSERRYYKTSHQSKILKSALWVNIN
jgi:hypothetical protein